MAKEIYKKILDIQKAVIGLGKDSKGNNAEYVSGNKVLGVVRPLMDKYGLLLTKDVVEYSFTPIQQLDKQGREKTEMFCAIKIRFTWIDAASGDTLAIDWVSSGANGLDKSLGSALTYGERYFLLKQFGIQTDRDDVDAVKTPEQEMSEQQAIEYIESLSSGVALNWAWQQYGAAWKGSKEIIRAFNNRKKQLTNETAQK